jgi:hypothetical protein
VAWQQVATGAQVLQADAVWQGAQLDCAQAEPHAWRAWQWLI